MKGASSPDSNDEAKPPLAALAPGATATVAAVLLGCQIVLHPLWTLAGAGIAKTVAGTVWEKYLMWTLAALTVASVLFVLFGGGT